MHILTSHILLTFFYIPIIVQLYTSLTESIAAKLDQKSHDKQQQILSGLYEDCLSRAELDFITDASVLFSILREWIFDHAHAEFFYPVYYKYATQFYQVCKDFSERERTADHNLAKKFKFALNFD